jgi:Asp/Glu/hydantoin racemase
MMKDNPRIVLLHATTVAMEPVHQAFVEIWNEATLINLLDDGLTLERAKQPELSDELIERFVDLVRYGYQGGADAILATCSAFGPAIERAAAELPVPVVKPNEAMFLAALACGTNIGMLATFAPSVQTMEAEFAEEAARIGSKAKLKTIVVEKAMEKLRAGDADEHNRLIAKRALELNDCDAIVLAHFSTSRAAKLVRQSVQPPVFTAPESAVQRLKLLVEQTAGRFTN